MGQLNLNGLAGFLRQCHRKRPKIDCLKGTVTCFDVSISNADSAEEFDVSNGI
jgi:hypothetical protein